MRSTFLAAFSWLRFAFAAALTGLAPPASAQDLPLRTTLVDGRAAVMMPAEAAGLAGGTEWSGAASLAGVDVRVSADGDLRTYRAEYLGRTHTAYADVSGPPVRFAFDTGERRFRVVSSTVLVELDNYDDDMLDQLVKERGALSGKAYPQLGFALIELPEEADPAEAVEFLDADPRVSDATVLFAPAAQRPMNVRARDVRPLSVPGGGTAPEAGVSRANAKESLTPDVFMYTYYATPDDPATVVVPFVVRNTGGADSEPATLQGVLLTLVPGTRDLRFEEELTRPIPLLEARGAPYTSQFEWDTSSLDAAATYYLELFLLDGDGADDSEPFYTTQTGFTLDSLKRVQHVCAEPGRSGAAGADDPLLAHQWHLDNTGQTAYASYTDVGGAVDEDLGMTGVLASGPNGDGVKVAVVDTGLETCHPDLRDSVEHGASFNFNAQAALDADKSWLVRMDVSDPFNFESTGGHGSSVAGLIAATADNGIGGRGIAPGVLLRGYNALVAERQSSALLNSLGASAFFPDSSDAHVFNMSFGSAAPEPTNINAHFERALYHGVKNLRSGLGAVYVKAAGNSFRGCASLERPINEFLGCGSSNSDDWGNLPYLILVGAFNADGVKSSYSSAGPNLWISAPGGEYGFARPALLTVDQMGWDRGFGALRADNPLDGEPIVNPDGDYTGRMNGTSAAAAAASGAVAVLLDEQPALTWRDVKHILAKTARRIDPDIDPVSETVGAVRRTLRQAWTENAAGYGFHNWYGFGAVDLDAAVEMAGEYTPDSLGEFRETSWFEQPASLAIPDNDGEGATQTVTVSGPPDGAAIEAVLLEVDIAHEFPNDLGIHLVSPAGTRSVVNQVYNETLAVSDVPGIRWRLLSNAFYGEAPAGDWQIEVFDAAEDDTGDLNGWRLKIYYGTRPEGEDDTAANLRRKFQSRETAE